MIWLGPGEKMYFLPNRVYRYYYIHKRHLAFLSPFLLRKFGKSEFSHQDLIRSFQSWAHFKGTYGGYNISLKDLLGNFVSLSSSSRPGWFLSSVCTCMRWGKCCAERTSKAAVPKALGIFSIYRKHHQCIHYWKATTRESLSTFTVSFRVVVASRLSRDAHQQRGEE